MSNRLLKAFAATLMTAGSLTLAQQAMASPIPCDSIWFSAANGGDANSRGCSHSGTAQTWLTAYCDSSPFEAHSPFVSGSYSNRSFDTGSCQWGVDSAGMEHR